jgi:Rieske Fe-S protein
MIIDETDLIQAYATVIAGVLIFMTVQRLFEWKEQFDEKSSRLLQLREKAIQDKEAFREQLKLLEANRRKGLVEDREVYEDPNVVKGYKDQKRHLEGQIRMWDDKIDRTNKLLY